MSIIPKTYDQWENCITVACGIPLTKEYVSERITALENKKDFHTQKFIDAWGEDHHTQTLSWFREAQDRLRG